MDRVRHTNSKLGVHCSSKGGETDGHTQGYKNVENAGECRKIRIGTQANLRLCRLPVRPQGQSGPTHTGQVAEPSGQNTRNTVATDLSGPAVHVLDRFTNSHRKASSPRPTTHVTHTVASQKQLEGTRITTKGDPNSQVPAPSLTMVATGRQHSHRPAITPNKTCSANLYRRIKRRVGALT